VSDHHLLAFCTKPRTRQYTALKPICVNSLKTYITALSKTVQADVGETLASKPFGILFAYSRARAPFHVNNDLVGQCQSIQLLASTLLTAFSVFKK
jgi:hypothetical protein